jgi:hypothetical protein
MPKSQNANPWWRESLASGSDACLPTAGLCGAEAVQCSAQNGVNLLQQRRAHSRLREYLDRFGNELTIIVLRGSAASAANGALVL